MSRIDLLNIRRAAELIRYSAVSIEIDAENEMSCRLRSDDREIVRDVERKLAEIRKAVATIEVLLRNEVIWDAGTEDERILMQAYFHGSWIRIHRCFLGYQWIVSWRDNQMAAGSVEPTIPEAQAAAIAAVERKMQKDKPQ